jgi:hypothetical protein
VDNKQKAEEPSKSKLETPEVTKPPAAVTPPEKAHAAPVVSEATGATPSAADKPTASNQTQPEKPSGLSESAAAARAATQKSQQAKAAESQTADKAQSDGAAKAEEGKTTTEQTPAQPETSKADKRKSGFFGWLKRKVKGT